MTGSEKQVLWADGLRAQWIADMTARIPANHWAIDDLVKALNMAADTQTDAKWWIENQGAHDRLLSAAYKDALASMGFTGRK